MPLTTRHHLPGEEPGLTPAVRKKLTEGLRHTFAPVEDLPPCMQLLIEQLQQQETGQRPEHPPPPSG